MNTEQPSVKNGPQTREVVLSKDLMVLYGVTERTANRRLHQLKEQANLPTNAKLPVDEFCRLTRIPRQRVVGGSHP